MNAQPQRILVIDDDRPVRQSIAAYLEDSGYVVDVADDGTSGLDLYASQQPDLVVCDLRMPGIDGIGVLRKISEDPREIPTIVISGAGVMADVVEALRNGASDYLIKPIIDLEVLEHAIERSLEQSRLKRQISSYRHELEQANRELQTHLQALEHDQQAGRHIQLKMLPVSPQTHGAYTFEHHIIPSLYLSGDFVEYITVGDRHIVFLIADVSGHGASSAFVTVLLKNQLARARSNYGRQDDKTILSPAQLLASINAELVETDIEKHATVFAATLDMESNALVYSVAGHLPLPVLAAPDQAPRFLEGKGLPVGMSEDIEYQEHDCQLPDTFTLALFSDGVLEILPQERLQEKEAALLDAVNEPGMRLNTLEDRLKLASVGEAPDDIAVMVVTRAAVH